MGERSDTRNTLLFPEKKGAQSFVILLSMAGAAHCYSTVDVRKEKRNVCTYGTLRKAGSNEDKLATGQVAEPDQSHACF